MARRAAPIEGLEVTVCTVPTDAPESDGTLSWDATTIVIVQAHAGEHTGLGYSYGAAAVGGYVHEKLAGAVAGLDALDVPAAWAAMRAAIRNDGEVGIAAMALSAVDVALWDLAARTCELPLSRLLGRYRDAVPVYGSGGFCSYSDSHLAEQLGGWADAGLRSVKMKVGREPDGDMRRVEVARAAIGDDVALFVDANGAYEPFEARRWAARYAEAGVSYFEEPVSSDDLAGLRRVRDDAPPGMAIAAGEYGYDLPYFQRMLAAGAGDVQQADATRCGGITGLLQAATVAAAHEVTFSAHCAPSIHAHACCAVRRLAHLEYFHDHVRVEGMLFEGTLQPVAGQLRPDPERPGLGLELRRDAVARYRAGGSAGPAAR